MRCSIGSAELILAQSIPLANPLSDRQLAIFALRHLAEDVVTVPKVAVIVAFPNLSS
jgi:hypothetical protein